MKDLFTIDGECVMTRIRYKNKLSQPVLCDTTLYQIKLVPKVLGAYIIDIQTKDSYIVYGKSLSDLKRKAKNELKKLGAKFGDEIRNRGMTEKLDLDKL